MDLRAHSFKRRIGMGDLDPVPAKHCRWCGQPCPGKRLNWCSQECVDEYLIRSSPRIVSLRVKERDHGVCALCGRDTQMMRRMMLAFIRQMQMLNPTYRPGPEMGPWLVRGRRRAWDAHHLIPVVEGGGCCGLDGYCTLCVRCHKEETRKLATTRRSARTKP